MSCISESHSTFWYWDCARGRVSKMQQCQSLICLCGTGRWGFWLVTTCQVFDSVTPPRHLQMIDSSAGRSSTQEWQGSGVRGRGSRGVGTHIGTWKDQQQYLSRAPQFLKQERGYIFVNFFSSFSFSFQRFWSCLCRKKVLLRYQYIMKKLFSLFSICCFFFLSLKMHKCSTETKKYQNRPS